MDPLPDYSDLDDRLLHLDEVDWVVFASVNAVAAVFARMDALGLDARDFHSASVAAIGSETAASLRNSAASWPTSCPSASYQSRPWRG